MNEVGTSLADSLKPIEYQTAEKPKSTVRTSEIIGNTPYKKISEKVYQKLPTEYALKMAKELDKKGVNFSGRITGDNTVLTIGKPDFVFCGNVDLIHTLFIVPLIVTACGTIFFITAFS